MVREEGIAAGGAVGEILCMGALLENVIRLCFYLGPSAGIDGSVEGVVTDEKIAGHKIIPAFEFQAGGDGGIVMDPFKPGADAEAKIPVGGVAELAVYLKIVLIVEACFLEA